MHPPPSTSRFVLLTYMMWTPLSQNSVILLTAERSARLVLILLMIPTLTTATEAAVRLSTLPVGGELLLSACI